MIGYACINDTLRNQKPPVMVNRTMRKANYSIEKASELALLNVKDFLKILEWNEENKIYFYRMSSDMFPWHLDYDFWDLDDSEEILMIFEEIKLKFSHHRLTFHPGPFNKPGSPNPDLAVETRAELNIHGSIMNYLGLPETVESKINIHIGGVYDDKQKTLQRFKNFLNHKDLFSFVKTRLTVENDDKLKGYSVKDLYEANLGIPIVFDYHHHKFNSSGLTEEEALNLAITTWPTGITPIVHYSESSSTKKPVAHSDYIVNEINTYGNKVDIMIEAKKKELALLTYREKYE